MYIYSLELQDLHISVGSDDERLYRVDSNTIGLRSGVVSQVTRLGRGTSSAARREFGQVEGLTCNGVKKVCRDTDFGHSR